jgi:hypothetical protein
MLLFTLITFPSCHRTPLNTASRHVLDADEGNTWILPKSSRPEHYRVHLDVRDIDSGSLEYSGEITIDIAVHDRTDHIVLHSKNHHIDEITAVSLETSTQIEIADWQQVDEFETLVVYFTSVLEADTRLALGIKYLGELTTSAGVGFYRTTFKTTDGETKFIGGTQFRSTGARLAFPCYDGEVDCENLSVKFVGGHPVLLQNLNIGPFLSSRLPTTLQSSFTQTQSQRQRKSKNHST